MIKPVLPLMTEVVQWSCYHDNDQLEQVPDLLKEVWTVLVEKLDFVEVLGKEGHSELKKMLTNFLDCVWVKCDPESAMFYVQTLFGSLVEHTKDYISEVNNLVYNLSLFHFQFTFNS